MAASWADLSEWWRAEVNGDPAYAEVVTPLLLGILRPQPGLRYLDLGCGEGRVMRELAEVGVAALGVDISPELVRSAGRAIVADMQAIPIRDSAFDGAYSVLTLEHLEDHEAFFAETARVTKPGGVLAIVINHPTWTAPGSTPISDSDGEVLWRSGDYFSNGSSEVSAGRSRITFYHRSMADLLNAAADSDWCLERCIEQPHHEYEDQSGIPRLFACRWRLGQ